MKQDLRFEFGENWTNFLRVLNEERIAEAEASLKKALRVTHLKDKRFIDIGCGSGLFSLAAARLGAKVHSFDYDPHSVSCTAELKRRYCPHDANWTIESGSVLDREYLDKLGRFDIVYSWGVLHHTGDMWAALANIVPLTEAKGRLFIAIYNDMGGASRRWRAIKKRYVSAGAVGKWGILIGMYGVLQFRESCIRLLRMQNPLPFRQWREYKKKRGMAPWYDFVDWVGGYPYEVARPEEIFSFFRESGFTLDYLTTGGLGCNEYVLTKTAAHAQHSVAPVRGLLDVA
ncbi:MAG: methyltransferase [Acidobacteria bacterium]|nr:methyltransferase [Acidobacteriota bacterium]